LSCQRIVGDGQIHRFEAFDFVAQAGGLFEFQVLGSFAPRAPKEIEGQKMRQDVWNYRVNFLCFIRLGSNASGPRRRFLSSS
jgi:hypothetical protein